MQIERRVLLIANYIFEVLLQVLYLSRRNNLFLFFLNNYHTLQFFLPSPLQDSKCIMDFFKERFDFFSFHLEANKEKLKSYRSVENGKVHLGSTILRLGKRACPKTLTSNILQLRAGSPTCP